MPVKVKFAPTISKDEFSISDEGVAKRFVADFQKYLATGKQDPTQRYNLSNRTDTVGYLVNFAHIVWVYEEIQYTGPRRPIPQY